MSTLGEIARRTMETGEPQRLTDEQITQFRNEFASEIGEAIETIRENNRKAFAECKHMVLD